MEGERNEDAEGTEAGSKGEEGKSRQAGSHTGTAGRAVRSAGAAAGGMSGASASTAAGAAAGERCLAAAIPGRTMEANLWNPVRGQVPAVSVRLFTARVPPNTRPVATAGHSPAVHQSRGPSWRDDRGPGDRHVPEFQTQMLAACPREARRAATVAAKTSERRPPRPAVAWPVRHSRCRRLRRDQQVQMVGPARGRQSLRADCDPRPARADAPFSPEAAPGLPGGPHRR